MNWNGNNLRKLLRFYMHLRYNSSIKASLYDGKKKIADTVCNFEGG